MAATSEDEIIARIQRSEREELRITLATFNGYQYVGFRVWVVKADGTMVPLKSKGCTVRLGEIERTIEALSQIHGMVADQL